MPGSERLVGLLAEQKETKTLGEKWLAMQQLPKPSIILNGPFEPFYNKMIYWLMSMNFWLVFVFGLIVTLIYGVLVGSLRYYLACHLAGFEDEPPEAIDRHIYLSLGEMVVPAPWSYHEQQCVAVSQFSGYMRFCMQCAGTAIIICKLMKPMKNLQMSPFATINRVDGRYQMEFVLGHQHGRVITNMQYKGTWFCPTCSEEGDQYMAVRDFTVEGSHSVHVPVSLYHIVDDHSPLRNIQGFEGEFGHFSGYLRIEACGIDALTGISTQTFGIYFSGDMVPHRRVGYEVKSLMEAIMENTLPVADWSQAMTIQKPELSNEEADRVMAFENWATSGKPWPGTKLGLR